MKPWLVARRGVTAGLSLLFVGLASFANARDATSEVGRWQGFGHAPGVSQGSTVLLDLVANPDLGPLALQGVISGLPAVQMPLITRGSVTPSGRLELQLINPASGRLVGFCDGSVFPVENFGQGSGQDDLGTLDVVLAATSAGGGGHLNLLHMFGGANWRAAGLNWHDFGGLPGRDQSHGAFILGQADIAGHSSFFATQDGEATSSSLTGRAILGDTEFAMVGTSNARGSIIMMCDGSVRNGDNNALIGLLFTGAIPMNVTPADPNRTIIGKFGIAPFNGLLPAVQRVRDAAMSFSWAAQLGG